MLRQRFVNEPWSPRCANGAANSTGSTLPEFRSARQFGWNRRQEDRRWHYPVSMRNGISSRLYPNNYALAAGCAARIDRRIRIVCCPSRKAAGLRFRRQRQPSFSQASPMPSTKLDLAANADQHDLPDSGRLDVAYILVVIDSGCLVDASTGWQIRPGRRYLLLAWAHTNGRISASDRAWVCSRSLRRLRVP